MIVATGRGVMSSEVGQGKEGKKYNPAEHVLEAERRVVLPKGSQRLPNSGSRALCYVYAVLMGLTGRPEHELHPWGRYIAGQAKLKEGWITSDSDEARSVVAAIAGLLGAQFQVIELRNSPTGLLISARSHGESPDSLHPVFILLDNYHYEAIV